MLYEEFCTARPPFGLGISPGTIDAIIAERKEKASVQAMARDEGVEPLTGPGNPTGRNQHSETAQEPLDDKDSCSPSYGAGAAYLVRRLKRDAPQIAEALAGVSTRRLVLLG